MCKSDRRWDEVVYSVRVVGDSGIQAVRTVCRREVLSKPTGITPLIAVGLEGTFKLLRYVNWRIQAHVGP